MKSLPVIAEWPLIQIEAATPLDINPGCKRCPMHEGVVTPCMGASGLRLGALESAILVVLPPPGLTEDKRGVSIQDATGAFIRRIIEKYWSGVVVFDQAFRCAPGSRKASQESILECSGYLAGVYRDTKPKSVLMFGGDATVAVVGSRIDTANSERGVVFTRSGVPCFVLPHPLPALRNAFLRRDFEDAVEWAFTGSISRPPIPRYTPVETVAEAEHMASVIRAAGGFSVDFETFGRPFIKGSKILSAAFAPTGSGLAFTMDEVALYDEEIRDVFVPLLADDSIEKTAQNAIFDNAHCASAFGITFWYENDTFLFRKLARADAQASLELLQATVGMYGGKTVVESFVGAGSAELSRSSKAFSKLKAIESGAKARGKSALPSFVQGPDTVFPRLTPTEYRLAVQSVTDGEGKRTFAYAAIPTQVNARYNAMDAVSTDAVHLWQRTNGPPHAKKVWKTIGRDYANAMSQMRNTGILVDRSRISELRVEMDGIIERTRTELFDLVGEFNPNAPDQVAEVLFDKLGVSTKGVKRTPKTGKYSITSEFLDRLTHPAAKLIVDLRQSLKFRTQYADGMEAFICSDGRIHPEYLIAGTETGRPSCRNPNLLNIPRASTSAGKKCRSIFTVRPGYTMVEADYSQLELRVAAFLSQDKVMMDIYARGEDFHLATAKLIAGLFGIDPDTVGPDHILREQAKVINFANLYGDTPVGIAAKLGIPVHKAEKLVVAISGAFKQLTAFIQKCSLFTRQNGYTTTWWDGEDFRRRPLYDLAGNDAGLAATAERGAWNTKVQGTGADFMNATLGRMNKILRSGEMDAALILTVYDSVFGEVRDDEVDDFINLTRTVGTSWNSAQVPMAMDFKKGRYWGELAKVA